MNRLVKSLALAARRAEAGNAGDAIKDGQMKSDLTREVNAHMALKIGDRVRLKVSPVESLVPHGTLGTVRTLHEEGDELFAGVEFDGREPADFTEDGFYPVLDAAGKEAYLDEYRSDITEMDTEMGDAFGESADEIERDIREDIAEVTAEAEHWPLVEVVA